MLQESKATVTAITRADSTSELPAGVQKQTVDYSSHESLVEGMRGQDALVITMAVTAPPESQEKLIRAAADAKVRWVFPNEWGTDSLDEEVAKDVWPGTPQIKMRKLIKELGMSASSITCGFWVEWSIPTHPNMFGFDIPKREMTLYDDGKTRMCISSKPYCGLAAARLMSLKLKPESADDREPTLEQFNGTSAFVAGMVVSQRDMLDAVQTATNSTDADWSISYEPSKKRWEDGKRLFATGDLMGFGKMLYSRLFFPSDGDYSGRPGGLDNAKLGLGDEDLLYWARVSVDLAYKPNRFRP